jgi:hypothetical protein
MFENWIKGLRVCLLVSVDGLCVFLCLLGKRKHSFCCKDVNCRRAEFVILKGTGRFPCCKVAAYIKCIGVCIGS